MTAVDAPTANLLDPHWWSDLDGMHRFFTWARHERPALAGRGQRHVGRHAATRTCSTSSGAARCSPRRAATGRTSPSTRPNTIALDDPEHLQQRRIVNRRFTPKAVEEHHGLLQDRIDELVDARHAQTDGSRSSQDLAAQLPSRLTAALLGFPEDRWEDLKSWSERLMRTDSLFVDPDAMMGMMTAIMEFNAVLGETADGAPGLPGRRPGVGVGRGRPRRHEPHARDRPVHRRWGGDDADRHRPWPRRPRRAPGAVGGRGGRPRARARVGRGGDPLGHARSTTCSAPPPATTRSAARRSRPATGSCSPTRRPTGTRRCSTSPFRFDIRRDPNHHLAFGNGHALLHRRQPGPARAAAPVRHADAALAGPSRLDAARHRAEHLRRGGAAVRSLVHASLRCHLPDFPQADVTVSSR